MKRKALFVGIDNYRRGIPALSCARNDANALLEYFTRHGYAEDDVSILRDGTTGEILDELDEQTKRLKPGDFFLFFFAGHGYTIEKSDGSFDRCLAGADDRRDRIMRGKEGISLSEIKDRADKARCPFVVILDACQTKIGSRRAVNTDAKDICSKRDLLAIADVVNRKRRDGESAPFLVVNSCDVGEVAYELEDKEQGLFSFSMLETFQQMEGEAKWPVFDENLINQIANRMEMHCGGYRQHPKIVLPDAKNACGISIFPLAEENEPLKESSPEAVAHLQQSSTKAIPPVSRPPSPPSAEELRRIEKHRRGTLRKMLQSGLLIFAIVGALAVFLSRLKDIPPPVAPPMHSPSPEEDMGIEIPGRLATSVEDWIASNELGGYFRESRRRLTRLHAQLLEDYKIRKQSKRGASDFTLEILDKYHKAFDVDSILQEFIIECCLHKEVRALPEKISYWFTTSEVRESIKSILFRAGQLEAELAALKTEMNAIGTYTWSQEKELQAWHDIQIRMASIAERASKSRANALILASDMAKTMQSSGGVEEVVSLNDRVVRLRNDFPIFAADVSKQLGIVNGQIRIAEFAANCRDMAESMAAIPDAYAKMKARQEEIRELVDKITYSHTRSYSDLNVIAQQAAVLKSRSRNEVQEEILLGERVQKLVRNYERDFGASAIYRLKRELPDPSAQTRIESYLVKFRQAVNILPGTDPTGMFAGIQAKAYQLSDRVEEETLIKKLETNLLAAQRLAGRQK